MNRSSLLIIATLFVVSAVPLLNTVSVDGASDINLTVNWTPTDPVVGDALNISLTSNKTLEVANISYCLRGAGTCSENKPMADDGTGMQFYFDYDETEFPNDTADFHIDIEYDGGRTTYKEFSITFGAVPTELLLTDLSPDNGSLISLFPNQTAEVSGHLEYDLDTFDIQSAEVNLSIRDTSFYNLTDIDENGNFSVGMFFGDEGDFVLDLMITEGDFGFTAAGEWDVSVSSWPRPAIGISADIEYDPLETPPGSADIYYRNASANASYAVSNTGTGIANNLTIYITIENSTYEDEIHVGNLSHPDNRYLGEVNLDSNSTGIFTLVITAEWDQMAPFQENFKFPVWKYHYTIVEPPRWEPHTVLVEMFTQSDCAPCVFVEEALERLLHEGEDFELITYALDDEISHVTAQARGVTSTPHVFIDYGVQEIVGGKDTDTSMNEISEAVANASRRDTPPSVIDFIEIDSNITARLSLPGTARDPISGTLTVYRIEEYSNLRNHQGIPMTDRFMGEVDRDFIDNMEPGEWLNITIDDLARGEGLVAVYYGDDGNVLQSASYKTHMDPGVYLAKASTWLKIDTPGNGGFNITIDHFEFQESDFDPIDFDVSLDKEIPGISVTGIDGGSVDLNWTSYTFDEDEADIEVTGAGRVRYHANFTFDVDIPENLSGTFSFKIRIRAGPKLFANTVAITASPSDDNTSEPLEILDYQLMGVGQNIYFTANLTGVPDGASVHGRVLPCLEDTGICGVPVELVLVKDDGGPNLYKAPVVGIDIDKYTHFTYYVWVEDQDGMLIRSQDVKVEIESLIDIEEDGEEDDDDMNLIWLIIGPLAILALIVIVLVLILLSRKKGSVEPQEEETSGEASEASEAEIAGITDNTLEPALESGTMQPEGDMEPPEEAEIPDDDAVPQEPDTNEPPVPEGTDSATPPSAPPEVQEPTLDQPQAPDQELQQDQYYQPAAVPPPKPPQPPQN
ncbi:MAG: hypothetical protein ACMUIG_07725 [Thermoplasmatota archaeon]